MESNLGLLLYNNSVFEFTKYCNELDKFYLNNLSIPPSAKCYVENCNIKPDCLSKINQSYSCSLHKLNSHIHINNKKCWELGCYRVVENLKSKKCKYCKIHKSI